MNLSRIGRLADQHWRKHRPNMVRHLRKKGVYKEALLEVQEKAELALVDLISRKGAKPHQAWELVMNQMVFLPSEDEVPVLPPDQMPYSQPQEEFTKKE